jgi:hypothetical protein
MCVIYGLRVLNSPASLIHIWVGLIHTVHIVWVGLIHTVHIVEVGFYVPASLRASAALPSFSWAADLLEYNTCINSLSPGFNTYIGVHRVG